MDCGIGVVRGFPFPAYSCIPLQPKACVSEIYCYSSGLSFAALKTGETESQNLAPNYISNHEPGVARRLKENITLYNEEKGQLLVVYVERRQSVGLLSNASVPNFINWLKFFGHFSLNSDA
jgi:hypothetical protein